MKQTCEQLISFLQQVCIYLPHPHTSTPQIRPPSVGKHRPVLKSLTEVSCFLNTCWEHNVLPHFQPGLVPQLASNLSAFSKQRNCRGWPRHEPHRGWAWPLKANHGGQQLSQTLPQKVTLPRLIWYFAFSSRMGNPFFPVSVMCTSQFSFLVHFCALSDICARFIP